MRIPTLGCRRAETRNTASAGSSLLTSTLASALVLVAALAACGSPGTPPPNDPPLISPVTARTTSRGQAVVVPLQVADEDLATLRLGALSGDQSLVRDQDLEISGSGSDRQLSIVPSASNTGTTQITVTAEDSGGRKAQAAFALQVTEPFAGTPSKLRALDFADEDYFGASVAISGDYAVVGAPGDDHAAGVNAGAVYILRRDAGIWTQVDKIVATDAAAGALFGASVAIDGDYAIVGSPARAFGPNANVGAAYVLHLSGGVWTETAKVVATDPAANALFGGAVAISGDLVVVGASGDATHGSGAGAAYVFQRDGNDWDPVNKITPLEAASGDSFGTSVDVSGNDVLVGAHGKDGATTSRSGAAYLFSPVGGFWVQTGVLTASDASTNDLFGFSVAVDGDHAVVGAPLDDRPGAALAGSVYLFERGSSGWVEVVRASASDAVVGSRLGYSVSLGGGFVVAGAVSDNFMSGADVGKVYVFEIRGVGMDEVAILLPSQPGATDDFGWSVGVDSGKTLAGSAPHAALYAIVGAPADSLGGVVSGAIYLVSR